MDKLQIQEAFSMGQITVDARGEQCPIPVVKATKAIGEMTEPSLLEVHVDNEIAARTSPPRARLLWKTSKIWRRRVWRS